MARPVVLSNGSLFVGLNDQGLVDDLYYPYVGQDNLKTSRLLPHQIGIFVDGQFSWVNLNDWQTEVLYEPNALVSSVVLVNTHLQVEIKLSDTVDSQLDAFMRHITVRNLSDSERLIKLFLHQVFQLSRDGHADTAFFVPEDNYIFDYKGHTAIIAYSSLDREPFSEFAVGNYGIEGKSGTFKDAEDGVLSGNLVEHGGVDSVVGHSLTLVAGQSAEIESWLAFGASQQEAALVHEQIKKSGVKNRLNTTRNHWYDWLKPAEENIPISMSIEDREHLITSLLIIKAHIDKRGAIIASGDSSLYNYGRDYYDYCWPRDGAYAIWPLIKLGYKDEIKNFINFCIDVAHPDGYLQHKFQPDGAYGSTWHPMMQEHHKELAIQEDETAIVLYMLAEYVDQSNDTEYFKDIFAKFVKPATDFLANYIDTETGLPHPSYDLWEQKFICTTYTSFLTSETLRRISKLTEQLEISGDHSRWLNTSGEIDSNLHKLFNKEKQYFIKGLLQTENGDIVYDNTLDASSAYSVLMFGGEVADSFALAQTVDAIEKQLVEQTPGGGLARYPGDDYFRANSALPGNPWFVCSFWLAQYYHFKGQTEKRDKLIDWAKAHSADSGMLSEQVDPESGMQVGVGPLVWSHAELINTYLLINS